MMQPKRRAPHRRARTWCFVPLSRSTRMGTRLGQGKGHYDRALGSLREDGARLIGVGWDDAAARYRDSRGPVGRPARRLRLARGLEMFSVTEPELAQTGVGIRPILAADPALGGRSIATFAPFVGHWPILVQALFYLVVGIAWIAPLKPLLRWTETGRLAEPAPGRRGLKSVLVRLYQPSP